MSWTGCTIPTGGSSSHNGKPTTLKLGLKELVEGGYLTAKGKGRGAYCVLAIHHEKSAYHPQAWYLEAFGSMSRAAFNARLVVGLESRGWAGSAGERN